MLTKLAKIAEAAKAKPKEQFTSLAHLINEELLEICHHEMDKRKASGVDRVTKEKYEENLFHNLQDLVKRMKRHAYRPQPVRRAYIPKLGTNSSRPLGIPTVYSYCTLLKHVLECGANKKSLKQDKGMKRLFLLIYVLRF